MKITHTDHYPLGTDITYTASDDSIDKHFASQSLDALKTIQSYFDKVLGKPDPRLRHYRRSESLVFETYLYHGMLKLRVISESSEVITEIMHIIDRQRSPKTME